MYSTNWRTLLFPWAFCFVVVVVASTTSAETLSYFRFEETTVGATHNVWINSDGPAPDGISEPTNGVSNTTDVFGSIVPMTLDANNASLFLDGGDAVKIGGGDDYDIGTGDFTVEAWIKGNGGSSTFMYAVAKTSFADKANGWHLSVEDVVNFEVRRGGSEKVFTQGTTDVLDGQWHHIAGVLDRISNELRVYVDGDLDATPTTWPFALANLDGLQDTYIGRRDGPRANYFFGSVDEVRISKVALNPSQFLIVPEPTTLIPFDIKPGSDPNSLNLKSKGVLPAAIFSTEDFDVRDVDVDTLLFGDPVLIDRGGTAVSPLRFAYDDVSGDGLIDLTLKFSIAELVENDAMGPDTLEGLLTGELLDGTPIEGTDSIRIVPPTRTAIPVPGNLTAVPGDANGDGVVSRADVALLLNHFGTRSGASFDQGDLDHDEAVTLRDLLVLKSNLSEEMTASPSAVAFPVPEPNTLTLAALGFIGWAARWRRGRQ